MQRPFESLYIHVPFCTTKCDYCAFYSVTGSNRALRGRYLERLKAGFARHSEACGILRSVYVGGGTPSMLDPEELEQLLGAVRDRFRLVPDAEFSVECNPGTLTKDKAARMAAGGVTRISLGVQSFDETVRAALGRQGPLPDLALQTAALRAAGIVNLGVDLMYAVPGQDCRAWDRDLRRACALDIAHLSTYALTLEEGSALASGRRAAPDSLQRLTESRTVRMWKHAGSLAAAAGLSRYEVSNFARPGLECRHNLDIWMGGTVLGCGPAACSFDGRRRWRNPADLDAWLAGAAATVDRLPTAARQAEILAFGCRTVRGWSRSEFCRRTGVDCMALRGPAIHALVADGLLHLTATTLAPTPKGLLFADLIAEALL